MRKFFRSPYGRYSSTIQGAGTSGPAVWAKHSLIPSPLPSCLEWGLGMRSKALGKKVLYYGNYGVSGYSICLMVADLLCYLMFGCLMMLDAVSWLSNNVSCCLMVVLWCLIVAHQVIHTYGRPFVQTTPVAILYMSAVSLQLETNLCSQGRTAEWCLGTSCQPWCSSPVVARTKCV